jgi:hypothetical protein
MMAVLRKERLEENVSSSSSCGLQVISDGVKSEPATLSGLNVWEASELGDMETALAIIDSGAASPNDVELLDVKETAYNAESRTPLYWACFGGLVGTLNWSANCCCVAVRIATELRTALRLREKLPTTSATFSSIPTRVCTPTSLITSPVTLGRNWGRNRTKHF